MKNRSVFAQLSDALQSIIGKTCWSVIAGSGVGHNVSCRLGEKIAYRESLRLKNPNLSVDEKNFDGEYAIYVTCSWRIETKSEVLAVHLDEKQDYSRDGRTRAALHRLIGARVKSVRCEAPAYDLVLEFDNGLTWSIFCDSPTSGEDSASNYVFWNCDTQFDVGSKSSLRAEPRSMENYRLDS